MRATWLLFRSLDIAHLARHRLRTALSIVGIGLGVMLLFAALISSGSLTESFSELRRAISGSADLEIRTGAIAGIDEATADRAATLAGVAVAAPLLQEHALVSGPGGLVEVLVVARPGATSATARRSARTSRPPRRPRAASTTRSASSAR